MKKEFALKYRLTHLLEVRISGHDASRFCLIRHGGRDTMRDPLGGGGRRAESRSEHEIFMRRK